MSTWSSMSTKGQGHSSIWSKSLRFNIFKVLFLNSHLAEWSQILCGVSWGWENENMLKLFRSHDQNGHHANIWWNFQKSSFLESKGRGHWNLICSIAYSSSDKFVKMMPQSWPWLILRQDQIGPCMLLYRKNELKTTDFSVTIVVYDMQSTKISTWGFMSTKGQGHSLTLVQFNQIQYF